MQTETEVPPLPRWVRAKQAQEILGGVSRVELTRLVQAGIIDPPAKLTRRLHLFSLENIVAAVERARKAAA
jgi:hypothetical protein